MWQSYWETAWTSRLDAVILFLGGALIVAHFTLLWKRYVGKKVTFVQGLDRYRILCLLVTELLPVLGLLGTVLSLMQTFKTFQTATNATPDLSQMIRTFAPALSTTISGLLMSIPNMMLNAIVWLACPTAKREQE